MSCPSQNQLAAYCRGCLNGDARRQIAAHVDTCSECQRWIDEGTEFIGSSYESMPGVSQIAQEPVPAVDMSSVQIAGYEVTEQLPEGGQAVVYRAIHLATKTPVALKVLPASRQASSKARRYFEREAELIARLDHPHIVKIRDSGLCQGQYFFAMEFIDGEPLLQYVDNKELMQSDRVRLFCKVVAAISFAHQRGIIHRDIKSANILVDQHGQPHILDFGIAKVAKSLKGDRSQTTVSQTGDLTGTLTTMAPEQAAGRSDLVDARSDVYALGVVLYQLLLGRTPYTVSGPVFGALQNIQDAQPASPRKIIKHFDSDLQAILLTSLAKAPLHRYQSAAQMLSDLKNWLAGEPISVRSNSTAYLLRKLAVRHRTAATVLALLAVIVLGFSAFSAQLLVRLRGQNLALQEAARQLQQERRDHLAVAQDRALIHLLDAWQAGRKEFVRQSAHVFTSDSREAQAIHLLLADSSAAQEAWLLRQNLQERWPGYTELILAESALADDRPREARAHYESSLQMGLQEDDPALAEHARLRLMNLLARANGAPSPAGQEARP